MTDPELLSDQRLSELAVEIVRDIYPIPDLLKRFNIPPPVFERLKGSRRFLALLGEAAITWDSSTNIATRIKVKGEAMIEQMMADGYAYYKDAKYPLADKVKMFQTIAKISGLYEPGQGGLVGADAGRPSDRVQITINLHPHKDRAGVITIDQPAQQLPVSDPIE